MDKIMITGLVASGIVGVKDPEREFPQDLLIDVELEYPLIKAGESDAIEDSISYSFVAKIVQRSVHENSFHTLEALAAYVVNEIFEETPADAVRIKIEKVNFVSKVAKVGVQIYRQRRI